MSIEHLNALLKTLQRTDHILILPHNDPDPDAVASALALRFLLVETLGIDVTLAYHGIIGRAENRALVNYLGQPFQPLATVEPARQSPIALVDTQPGTGNNMAPAGANIVVVIDHHPWLETTGSASFSDVRSEFGSTSTILTEYLKAADLEPDQQLATALLYGIKSDTVCLTRGVSPADTDAYFYLQPRIDVEALLEIERAQVSIDYFKSFDTALRAARIYGEVIVSYLGIMIYPDLAAEMADMLLRLEGSQWVICMGIYQDKLILAVRTRNHLGGAGQLARSIVGNQGVAGGHGVMAGGQMSLNGRESRQLVRQLTRRALQSLNVSADIKGVALV